MYHFIEETASEMTCDSAESGKCNSLDSLQFAWLHINIYLYRLENEEYK